MLCRWEELPQNMQNDAVRPYYDSLQSKKCSLFLKNAKALSEDERVLENKINAAYTKSQNEGGQEI